MTTYLSKRSIHALPVRVFHACISQEDLKKCAWALMKLFLLPESSFFHFTQTGEETSLILSEESLSLFPPNTLTVAPSPWRPLSLLGSIGQGSGIVSYVSNIVARAKVSIFYLSTAQNDLIFVQEHDFERAVDALKEHFKVISNPLPPGPIVDISAIPQKLRASQSSEIVLFKYRPNLVCKLFPKEVQICGVSSKENRSDFAQFILSQVFFSQSSPFFSFTETEDEISFLVESSTQSTLSDSQRSLLTFSEEYCPLQRFEKLSLGEVGVISALSKILSQAKVPLSYLSTYHSAYLLVPSKEVSIAKLCLETAGYGVKIFTETKNVNAKILSILTTAPSFGKNINNVTGTVMSGSIDGKGREESLTSGSELSNSSSFSENDSTSTLPSVKTNVDSKKRKYKTKNHRGQLASSNSGQIPDEYNVTVMLHFPDDHFSFDSDEEF